MKYLYKILLIGLIFFTCYSEINASQVVADQSRVSHSLRKISEYPLAQSLWKWRFPLSVGTIGVCYYLLPSVCELSWFAARSCDVIVVGGLWYFVYREAKQDWASRFYPRTMSELVAEDPPHEALGKSVTDVLSEEIVLKKNSTAPPSK